MITIQRVRVRWSSAARGAPDADARRGLSSPRPFPLSPAIGDVTVHDVFIDEAAGYVLRENVIGGGLDRARDGGLWMERQDADLVVGRVPADAAYPRQAGPGRLFTLRPGQVGRYRANFRLRLAGCCAPAWYYEDWLVLIAHGELRDAPDHDVDHRVHLYGGSRRPRSRRTAV